MKGWTGQSHDGKFGVEFVASALDELDRYCSDAGSLETGGILIGSYTDSLSLAIVHEATPPPADSRQGRSWFFRGVSGLRELLGERWRAKRRTFYVGEWHLHPVSHIEPSGEDFERMRKISATTEYDCRAPLLLILGSDERHVDRPFRVFVCPSDSGPLELLPPSKPRKVSNPRA